MEVKTSDDRSVDEKRKRVLRAKRNEHENTYRRDPAMSRQTIRSRMSEQNQMSATTARMVCYAIGTLTFGSGLLITLAIIGGRISTMINAIAAF